MSKSGSRNGSAVLIAHPQAGAVQIFLKQTARRVMGMGPTTAKRLMAPTKPCRAGRFFVSLPARQLRTSQTENADEKFPDRLSWFRFCGYRPFKQYARPIPNIDARPHLPDRRNLLHRTAGPYIRVKMRRTQIEQMWSALAPISGPPLDARTPSRRHSSD
jgi:hypothetical protein